MPRRGILGAANEVQPRPQFVSTADRPSNYVRNAAANWMAFLFVAVVTFFLSPFIVHHLGDTAYGVWALLAALVGYLGLLDFGVRGAVTRYVAHHHAANDSESCSSIVSAGLAMYGMLGSLVIVIAVVIAYLSPFLFNIPEAYVDDTRIVLIVGGVTMAVTMLGAVFGGIIAGLQRFDISSGIEVAVTTIRAAAIVTALSQGYGLVSLATIHLAGSLLSGLTAWVIARRLYPDLRIRFRVPLRAHMRTILSFSVYLSAIHVFGVLIYYTDVVVISVFLPISVVTFYAIAGNLCDNARQVAMALSALVTPRVSALTSTGSKAVGGEILGVARAATLVTAPIAAIFLIRGESFINLWMGPEYGPASGEVLRILAFVTLLSGARSVAVASIIGANKHRALVPAYAAEALCNLVLSVLLVRPMGLVGVALAALIPSLIVSLGYLPSCLARSTGTRVGLFYKNGWLLPMLACVPFALLNALLEQYLPAANLAIFFLQILLTLPLVAAGAAVLCLAPEERMQIGLALRKLIARAT
jgi:O-antigen/teichoic acid export membrane protein